MPAPIAALVRLDGAPRFIRAGLPLASRGHARGCESLAAEREQALHHREQHKAFAEAAPLAFGQGRTGEDVAGSKLAADEEWAAIGEGRGNVRGVIGRGELAPQ